MSNSAESPDAHIGGRDPTLEAVAALLTDNPDELYLRRRYGLLLFRSRRFKDAATQFSQLARAAPGDGEPFLFLARTLLRLKMYNFARAAAEMASQTERLHQRVSRTLRDIAVQEHLSSSPASVVVGTALGSEISVPSSNEIRSALEPDEGAAQDLEQSHRRFALRSRSIAAGRNAAEKRLDASVRFLLLIKGLILRNIAYTRANKVSSLFMVGGKMAIIINFHVMFFYATSRTFAGQISLLVATLAPFLNWTVFSQIKVRAWQPSRAYNRVVNIKWIHLFIADSVWDLMRILLSAILIVVFGQLYLPTIFVLPIVAPDIPLLFAMVALAAMLGIGMGLINEGLEEKWPLFVAADHVLQWIMFITCGAYESYVTLPTFLSPYFALNPTLTITEYVRKGFDPSYPVGDLTLWYPFAFASVTLVIGLALRAKNSKESGEATGGAPSETTEPQRSWAAAEPAAARG